MIALADRGLGRGGGHGGGGRRGHVQLGPDLAERGVEVGGEVEEREEVRAGEEGRREEEVSPIVSPRVRGRGIDWGGVRW